VDRELYIPRSWTCDPDRCRAAGLGKDTVFATKPELAARMIGRFLDAGHRVDWVAGDEVYGGDPKLRSALEERGAGAKGHRFHDWAVIDLAEPRPGSHRLLVRRNRTTGELASSDRPGPDVHWEDRSNSAARARPCSPGPGRRSSTARSVHLGPVMPMEGNDVGTPRMRAGGVATPLVRASARTS
jgi:DDE superfamily endonuclease